MALRLRVRREFQDGNKHWKVGEIGMWPEGHSKTDQYVRWGFLVYDDTLMDEDEEAKLPYGVKVAWGDGYRKATDQGNKIPLRR